MYVIHAVIHVIHACETTRLITKNFIQICLSGEDLEYKVENSLKGIPVMILCEYIANFEKIIRKHGGRGRENRKMLEKKILIKESGNFKAA